MNTISQSFIKDYADYLEGNECGLLIKAKYIDGRIFDDPEDPGAKELGAYFEFIAFGTLPKSGIVPKPVMLSSGKDMDAKYRLATINAKRVRNTLDDLGLKVIQKGWHTTQADPEDPNYVYSGTIDLLVEATRDIEFDTGVEWKAGDVFVIDLKYSGLVGDTIPAYNKHGWKWSAAQKAYHGIQAKQYHFLTGVPFYFLVTQSNNKEGTLSDIRFFHVPITQDMVRAHIANGNKLFDDFRVEAVVGFTPRPSMRKCGKCPLKDECDRRHTFPHPEIVDLNAA